MIEGSAIFVCYFVVFNEFGFSPSIVNRLLTKPYFPHNELDIYDPSSPTLGNTNLICEGNNLKSIDSLGHTALDSGN